MRCSAHLCCANKFHSTFIYSYYHHEKYLLYSICKMYIYTSLGFSFFPKTKSLTHYTFSIPLCALINQHLSRLAAKFPATKFLKSISTTCIPNYPDRNLPTFFIYFENDMKAQIVGPLEFGGMNLTIDGDY